MHVPKWLEALLGEREKAVIYHKEAQVLCVDVDGERLPNHQRLIEAPCGSVWIDSKLKRIIG